MRAHARRNAGNAREKGGGVKGSRGEWQEARACQRGASPWPGAGAGLKVGLEGELCGPRGGPGSRPDPLQAPRRPQQEPRRGSLTHTARSPGRLLKPAAPGFRKGA